MVTTYVDDATWNGMAVKWLWADYVKELDKRVEN
jgi:hypothetical protein